MDADREYIVGVLKELVEIRTENPPGNEKALAEHIAPLLGKIGMDTSVDDVGEGRANVIGVWGENGKSPVLVLNGHLDTVPVKEGWSYPPHEATIVESRVYGLGSSDMKGALAAMMAAVKFLRESKKKLKGTLILSFVADEERKNTGTIKFLDTYKNLDYVVIGEPTDLEIAVSHRGVARFKIVTHGLAGHASDPSRGRNAIYKMSRVLDELIRLEEGCAKQHEREKKNYSEEPSLSVTMITGGTAENIIPDLCEIVIDRRTIRGERVVDVEKELQDVLSEIGRHDDEFHYTLETLTGVNAWNVDERSRILKHGIEAYRLVFNRTPEMKNFGATCEAPLFAERGIDAFIFGPGSIVNAHTKDEYIEIDQLEKAARYYFALIERVLAV